MFTKTTNETEKRLIRINVFEQLFGHLLTFEQLAAIYDVRHQDEEFGYTRYTAIDINGNVLESFID